MENDVDPERVRKLMDQVRPVRERAAAKQSSR
jgi:hypothetical protein